MAEEGHLQIWNIYEIIIPFYVHSQNKPPLLIYAKFDIMLT